MNNLFRKISGIFLVGTVIPNIIIMFKNNWVKEEENRLKGIQTQNKYDEIIVRSALVNCKIWKESSFINRLFNLPSTKF